ncbi:winged helix-turn-helix transcriptional regulator [Phreatobacter sp. AB_2022a]|uniref:winged helix-turn-helix transcriptional regulator n=1 Tax=Phreatobacter sp. AB_2022a TaxID=3003134 RepID=UPI00228720DF|nr:winged helix-turn-helix transcriptional regulator [Phreatobacter sp. AB_2022a]MCZ0733323.1 winged helix-turn-helix transcriptional regulator [Phreatobacter sp. AB_2022a]
MVPAPGEPARGSRSGRPIMVLLDLLGRRMALRILWELKEAGRPLTFRALAAAAETNPSVLNARLKELRAAGLVAHGAEGYRLGADGLALVALVLPLHQWAEDWAARRPAAGGEPA